MLSDKESRFANERSEEPNETYQAVAAAVAAAVVDFVVVENRYRVTNKDD